MGPRPTAESDRRFMGEAVELARSVLGLTSPNPAVGCVIVRGGRAIAHGATAPGGRPHAESQALARAGGLARGATAFVSLEPCAHYGRTPPCAEALVRAGIRRAVIGCVDPFPQVRGRGIEVMRRAGIEVAAGVMEEDCRRVNEGFFTRIAKGRPFVLLKLAMTLDGRIAAEGGDSRWISSQASRALVHRWRRECDAVIVGAGTVIADDPRLTCRIEGGRDPARVIIDPALRTAARARVFRERSSAPTLLITSVDNATRARRRYGAARVEIVALGRAHGKFGLDALMKEMGRRGWNKVMIEGGARLAGAALAERMVDRVAFFLTPRILGCGIPAVTGLDFTRVSRAIRLGEPLLSRIGDDWLVEARPLAG